MNIRVLWLFLTVPWVDGLRCVAVVFPDHTHYFFFANYVLFFWRTYLAARNIVTYVVGMFTRKCIYLRMEAGHACKKLLWQRGIYSFWLRGAYIRIRTVRRLHTRKSYMSHDMRFPTMWYIRPAKAQSSLRIRAV